MIHLGGETLFASRIRRRRKRTANVAAHNSRSRRTQLSQRPNHIVHRESTAFPIRDRLFRAQTIKIDRDVDIRSRQLTGEPRETLAPIRAQDRPAPGLIGDGTVVRPGMHFESSLAFRAPVAEELARPPALEVSATPHADFFTAGNSSARLTQPPQPHLGGRMSQSG